MAFLMLVQIAYSSYFYACMNNSANNRIRKELDQVIIDLLIHQPFFGRLLAKSVKVIHSAFHGISFMPRGKEVIRLHINPGYWDTQLSAKDEKHCFLLRKTALKKQLIHFIFGHDLLMDDFENETIFCVAAELSVNQLLEADEKIPGIILLPERFPGLQLEPNRDLKYYYEELYENLTSNEIKKLLPPGFIPAEFLKTWKALQLINKPLDQRFRNQFIFKAFHSKNVIPGQLPLPLVEYVNRLKGDFNPSLNWKRLLRLFYNSSKRTKLVNSIHRNSKRYDTFPGVRIRQHPRLLVALDTSGSIKNTDLKQFFHEIHHLWKQRTEIRVIECDTHIRREYQYNGNIPDRVFGRGNTDFNDPIRYANGAYNPDALIYLTDGFGPKPRLKPDKPVLWVISQKGIKRNSKAWNDLPGRKVKLSEVF